MMNKIGPRTEPCGTPHKSCTKGFALKDSHCHRSAIIDFTEDQQLMSVYIYILMTYLNGIDELHGD